METPALKVDVNATACSQAPSLGFLSTVLITQSQTTEEFIINESDGSVSSLGSFPSSSLPHPPICLKLPDFTPDNVYQHVFGRIHDHLLSNLIFHEIVVESQTKDLPRGPLFMKVSVNLTHKSFAVVPSSISRAFKSDNCTICLGDQSESKTETKPICQLPQCGHLFHETCLLDWLDRGNSSCPLCRQDFNHNRSEVVETN